jgi:hypothetical protein
VAKEGCVESASGDDLETVRRGLLEPHLDEQTKLGLLRKLIEHKSDPRAREVLKAAAAAPANAPLVHVIVRTFGYLDVAGVIEDLEGFARHPDPAIASNALKAAAARDARRAVEMAMPLLRGGPAELTRAAAVVLAERCRETADAAVASLASSADPSSRLAAVNYLRALPADAAQPALGRMLDREVDAELRALLGRLLGRSPPEPPTDRGTTANVAAPLPPPPLPQAPAPVDHGSRAPASPLSPATSRGTEAKSAIPAPASARTTGKAPVLAGTAPPDTGGAALPSSRGTVVIGLGVMLAAYLIYRVLGLSDFEPAPRSRPPGAGGVVQVGDAIHLEGRIRAVHEHEEILFVEAADQRLASVFFRKAKVRHLAVGTRVTVEAVVVAVHPNNVLVARGEAVRTGS